jgi:4-phospho-D-threonate 3-dehydrogenase / 4-phospho-D-erythronate 3-dehydrogenase
VDLNKPLLAITMGDPSSIGPEITIKAAADERLYKWCKPVVIGDANTLRQAADFSKIKMTIRPLTEVSEARFEKGVLDVIDLKNVKLSQLEHGKVSAMAGEAAFQNVKKAIELALAKEVDGTVTGPIHKESINQAGHHFSGHTEIYAHYTNTKKYAMLLVDSNLKVIHVSTHVSLRQACDLVKKERIIEVIELIHDACIQFGIENPKLGIAGLNPHASDGGLFGNEEQYEIVPALEKARAEGYNVEGPVPADTLFAKAAGGLYDGCVAMYHDQGHIPFKMNGFVWDNEKQKMKSVSGVNITLGLPIIRSSVDHGTAFEIAGKGIASHDALILAVEYAARMAGYHPEE